MQALEIFSHLNHWQVDLMTMGLLLASTVCTLIPEELIFVSLGILAHFGKVNPIEAILAAQIGLIPADAAIFWIGKKLGKDALKRKPFSYLLTESIVDRSLRKLEKYGSSLVFFTRFTPMLRTPVYLAAGLSEMTLKRSIFLDWMAASIQIPMFFAAGYLFGEGAEKFVSLFTYFMLGMFAIFAFMSLFKALLRSKRLQKSIELEAQVRKALELSGKVIPITRKLDRLAIEKCQFK